MGRVAPLERRDAPVTLATVAWLLIVSSGLAIAFILAVVVLPPHLVEQDSPGVGTLLPCFVWFGSHALLGLACLRGWRVVRLLWMAFHGLVLVSLAMSPFNGGDSFWIYLPPYVAVYVLLSWMLLRRRARSFFSSRSPGEQGAGGS